jgi:hypothetical protein
VTLTDLFSMLMVAGSAATAGAGAGVWAARRELRSQHRKDEADEALAELPYIDTPLDPVEVLRSKRDLFALMHRRRQR